MISTKVEVLRAAALINSYDKIRGFMHDVPKDVTGISITIRNGSRTKTVSFNEGYLIVELQAAMERIKGTLENKIENLGIDIR